MRADTDRPDMPVTKGRTKCGTDTLVCAPRGPTHLSFPHAQYRRSRWLPIRLDCRRRANRNHNIPAHIFLTFSDLTAALDAVVIAIDIPIGLTDHGPRRCDLDARRHLGPKRGTSVFP